MPIYEYQCEVCDHHFEVIQKFSEEPVTSCVVCAGPVRRVLSAPALVFKGSGWYVTDYASPERKKAIEGEKKGADGPPDTSSNEGKAKAEKGTSDQQPPRPSSPDQD
ncbi:MAG: FmdB family zinc ribbon protein [Candidatus Methylomirabilales bacterium]